MICKQCEGTGKSNNNFIDYSSKFYFMPPKHCDKCHGTGELNWIEAVVGKKQPEMTNVINHCTISNFSATTVSIEQEFKQEIIDAAVEKMTKIVDEKLLKLIEAQIYK